MLTTQKQPGADTRRLTAENRRAVEELRPALPADVRIDPTLYRQREFIDYGAANVPEALRDGSVLVFIVLLVFLVNFRTTVIVCGLVTSTACEFLLRPGLFWSLRADAERLLAIGDSDDAKPTSGLAA